MYDNDIFWMLTEPIPHIVSEVEHLLDAGDVVVVDHDPLHPVVEVRHVVGPLAAEVVQLVSVLVLVVQEGCNLLNRIPVQRPNTGTWETGGNHSIGHLQIGIELF